MVKDVASILHPLPELPDGADEHEVEAWQAVAHEVERDRELAERELGLAWDEDQQQHPLIREIEAAREDMLRAEKRRRLLVAYGREFVGPRPFRLEDLARAAGMSISGVRTAYAEDEVDEVARLIGAQAPPARATR